MNIVRVLVVDDSSTIRAMMRQILEDDAGITVAGVAASADEAEAVLDAGSVDVVTLDMEMPGLSGMDYLRQISSTRRTPVVMLSSHTAPGKESRTEALLAGAAGCFNKADAVRQKSQLIALVKAAAHHEVRLAKDDAQALKAARARH